LGAGVLAQANGFTSQEIALLDSQLKRRIDRSSAGSAALAGVPQAVVPGRGFIGAGIGGRGDQVSFAIGLSTVREDKHNSTFKAGVSFDANGGYSTYNAGVGFHF